MFQQVRPNAFPPVVKNLLIINALFFLASWVLANRGILDLNAKLGLFYPESSYFRPYQFVTHVFMHGSMFHILSNMFSLWMFGSQLENYWGPQRFFIYYFVTAFGAAFVHLGVSAYEIQLAREAVAAFNADATYDNFWLLVQNDYVLSNNDRVIDFMTGWKNNPTSQEYIAGAKEIAEYLVIKQMNVPVVGASGAVFGLLLGFGMLFPNTTLLLIFFPFPIKAKYFVLIFGAFELFQGLSNNPSDNVAHFAHLGGMLFGFIMIKYWNKTNRNSLY
jgi:membrane associated rhomboid family serine protease